MTSTKSLIVGQADASADPVPVERFLSQVKDDLLSQIREEWQARKLIQRVSKLLLVDPSSACQRLLNATVHDLREKIHIAGFDIASEAAKQKKLPTVGRAEDLEHYTTMNILRLAHGIGLLTDPASRRLLRAYDIRKDLEHEDDEYEANVADCLYIFQACIEEVLSKDPIQVIKVTDIKEFVEQSELSTLTKAALEEFEHAPEPRQKDIWQYLTSVALDPVRPDIVRHNSYVALSSMRELVHRGVLIDVAKGIVDRIGRNEPRLLDFRVAYAAGVLPYLKKRQINAFFEGYAKQFKSTSPHWSNHGSHGDLLRGLEEVGGLDHCPQELLEGFVEWLVICYIGEGGGYGRGFNRPVFYSDVGAPICLRLLCTRRVNQGLIEDLRESKNAIKVACSDKYIARRLEQIIDRVGG